MTKTTATTADPGKSTTYIYSVVVEPDEDAWYAYCPALQTYGAATWGRTRAEALRHIHEVVAMVVAELIEDGEAIPEEAQVYDQPLVPNAETIEAMKAARRGDLVTIGGVDDLLGDLHADG